jgi:hypothetical protein
MQQSKMEAQMKAIILDGTPEEVHAAAVLFLGQSASPIVLATAAAKPAEPATLEGDIGEITYIDQQTARRYFNRRPLADTQRTVFVTLAQAHPAKVTTPELREKLDMSTNEFSGMRGALGRRLKNTDGWTEGQRLFVQEWDAATGYYHYGLPESVIEAMKAEKLI